MSEHVALVLATSTGGIGRHVRSLAAGLAEGGVVVTVLGPAATEELFGFTRVGARFAPVEIAAGPRPFADAATVRRLRRLLSALAMEITGPASTHPAASEITGPNSPHSTSEITGPSSTDQTRRAITDPTPTPSASEITGPSSRRTSSEITGPRGGSPRLVVHAHGLRAGLLAGLALGRRRRGRTPLVVTWHNAVLATGPRRLLLARMEREVARRADVTLGASSDLVDRARALGAVDARLGPVSAPPLAPPTRSREQVRAELGAGDRPVVLAVGRLAPQKGYGLLLDAAAGWRSGPGPQRQPAPPPRPEPSPRPEPPPEAKPEAKPERSPLVLVAGDGPLRPGMRARIDAADLPVRLLGHRTDVPDLLLACDIVVLPSVWEARALVAQEALRAGRPLVATAVGGIPELVGEAAVLVPYGDAAALRDAVSRLLADPAERDRLAALGREQARTWPDEADTIAHARAVYRELGERLIPW